METNILDHQLCIGNYRYLSVHQLMIIHTGCNEVAVNLLWHKIQTSTHYVPDYIVFYADSCDILVPYTTLWIFDQFIIPLLYTFAIPNSIIEMYLHSTMDPSKQLCQIMQCNENGICVDKESHQNMLYRHYHDIFCKRITEKPNKEEEKGGIVCMEKEQLVFIKN